jgi:hypothetical protein
MEEVGTKNSRLTENQQLVLKVTLQSSSKLYGLLLCLNDFGLTTKACETEFALLGLPFPKTSFLRVLHKEGYFYDNEIKKYTQTGKTTPSTPSSVYKSILSDFSETALLKRLETIESSLEELKSILSVNPKNKRDADDFLTFCENFKTAPNEPKQMFCHRIPASTYEKFFKVSDTYQSISVSRLLTCLLEYAIQKGL